MFKLERKMLANGSQFIFFTFVSNSTVALSKQISYLKRLTLHYNFITGGFCTDFIEVGHIVIQVISWPIFFFFQNNSFFICPPKIYDQWPNKRICPLSNMVLFTLQCTHSLSSYVVTLPPSKIFFLFSGLDIISWHYSLWKLIFNHRFYTGYNSELQF